MGRSNKEGSGNRRVEVALKQNSDGSYRAAKPPIEPVKVKATRQAIPGKAKVRMQVDHAILKDGKKFE